MTAQLTIEDVQIHHAVTTFQRDPERPLPYRRLDRWRDWLAGWSDRPQLAGVRGETPGTPWLQQLGQECRTRLEAERRGTLAVDGWATSAGPASTASRSSRTPARRDPSSPTGKRVDLKTRLRDLGQTVP